MSGVAGRLAALGLRLPEPTAPVGSYLPARVAGGAVHTSGHVGKRDGAVVRGLVGADLSTAEARDLARSTALDLLGSAAAAAGGVDRLAGVLRVTGFVAGVPGFEEQPQVLNGASDLFVEVFGEAGRHVRSAVGVASLPLGAALEIEAVFLLA